jgi:hypothetical protein
MLHVPMPAEHLSAQISGRNCNKIEFFNPKMPVPMEPILEKQIGKPRATIPLIVLIRLVSASLLHNRPVL